MKRLLTDTAVKNAKLQKGKSQSKFTDGGGMCLLVNKSGKYWRYNYRFNEKFKTLALGVYPDISLKRARIAHENAREKVKMGIDPTQQRKIQRLNKYESTDDSFEFIAREWFEQFKDTWSESHSKRLIARLENDVFPWLGASSIKTIEPPEILAVMRRIQDRGALESAHRVRHVCGQVFRYAIATGRAQRDQTADLRGALPPYRKKHFAAIKKPDELKDLVLAMDSFRGTFVVKCAIKLSLLVMLRPGELRHGNWDEIDFDNEVWIIPASRMKARKTTKEENLTTHIVPLSTQALEILRELKPLTGRFPYIFTGARNRNRPMSENAVNAALRSLGFSNEQMTAHGFRATASTFLNEMGFNPDAIEAQLAHKDKNEIRAAYNRAQYLDERRIMLQSWADYINNLKE